MRSLMQDLPRTLNLVLVTGRCSLVFLGSDAQVEATQSAFGMLESYRVPYRQPWVDCLALIQKLLAITICLTSAGRTIFFTDDGSTLFQCAGEKDQPLHIRVCQSEAPTIGKIVLVFRIATPIVMVWGGGDSRSFIAHRLFLRVQPIVNKMRTIVKLYL